MKILIVTQYYFPEQFLINEIAPDLVKRGHQVTVLTGWPNYPEGKIFPGYGARERQHEFVDGVEVRRCFLTGRGSGIASLGLNYLTFAISSSFKMLFTRKKYDLIFCYQLSPLTLAIAAIVYKKRHNTPIFLYCLDLWPESLKVYIKGEKSLLFRLVKRLSTYIYRQCDMIGVSSPSFQEYFECTHGIAKERISFIAQHANEIAAPQREADSSLFNFMYAGNVGQIQGLDTVVQAVNIIRNREDFVFHIVGDGSYFAALRDKIADLGLQDKFVLHGRVPPTEIPHKYSLADVLVITLTGESLIGVTIPAKLQSYMSAGKPILGSINGDAQSVIAQADCGYYVSSGHSEALSEAMVRFIENSPQQNAIYGQNAKNYFNEHFTKEIYIEKLESIFNDLQR